MLYLSFTYYCHNILSMQICSSLKHKKSDWYTSQLCFSPYLMVIHIWGLYCDIETHGILNLLQVHCIWRGWNDVNKSEMVFCVLIGHIRPCQDADIPRWHRGLMIWLQIQRLQVKSHIFFNHVYFERNWGSAY